MNKCTISSAGLNVLVQSDYTDLRAYLTNNPTLGMLVPGVSLPHQAEQIDFTITHKQSSRQETQQLGEEVVISDDWEKGVPGYLLFFLYKTFCFLYQGHDKLAFHASSVVSNGMGALILGNPGDGKTNVMLNMGLNHNAEVLSTNRSLVEMADGKPVIAGGTSVVDLRSQDLDRYSSHPFYAKYRGQTKPGSYVPNIMIDANEVIGFSSARTPLNKIYIVKLGEGADEFIRLDKFSSRIRLYNNASLAAWGECLLFNGTMPSPLKDTPDHESFRLDFIGGILADADVFFVRGSMDFVCRSIRDTMVSSRENVPASFNRMSAQIPLAHHLADYEKIFPPRRLAEGVEVLRIAPSPTGMPHIGTAMQAIINRALADKSGGVFILRIEDTDQKRYVENAEQEIRNSLDWLGVPPQEGPHGIGGNYGPYRQSERLPLYQMAANHLVQEGKAYRCFCCPDRLESLRAEQMKQGKTPGYDGNCRNIPDKEASARASGGEPYVIRLRAPGAGRKLTFNDLVRGDITFESGAVDDAVLLKSDGYPTYHLASVVDDHFMRVTTVVRGEEWISSTPKHQLLYEAFGWEMPKILHTVLLRDEQKRKLSKRSGDTSIAWFQNQGYVPEAFRNFLTRSIWAHPEGKDIYPFEDFVNRFNVSQLPASGPVADMTRLLSMNAVYLGAYTPQQRSNAVLDYMARLEGQDTLPLSKPDNRSILESHEQFSAIYEEMRANPAYLEQVMAVEPARHQRLFDAVANTAFYFAAGYKPASAERLKAVCTQAEKIPAILRDVSAIDPLAVDAAGWDKALRETAARNGVKDKEVFMLTRLAITGQERTPSLHAVAQVLGAEIMRTRILGHLAPAAQNVIFSQPFKPL